jgi:hypothetical protein
MFCAEVNANRRVTRTVSHGIETRMSLLSLAAIYAERFTQN